MHEMPSLPSYPTDLNDLEWAVVDKILGGPPKLGRPPRFERRAVLGAIFYMVRTGGSWRLLPHDLPPWRIVYYYFALWRAAGLFEKLHAALREAARIKSGKKKPPRPRSWIARACARLAEAECAATMRARRSWDANVICWWIPMA
jgi:transposase